MRWLFVPSLLIAIVVAAGCATRRADHFYALAVQPAQSSGSHAGFARQITLHVTLPSLVDRAEMVLTSGEQVSILEHERWASPLPDQVIATLGQDIEARRADVMIANRSLEQGKLPSTKISVEIVHWTAQRGGRLTIEARWRVADSVSGNVSVGRDIFSAAVGADGYDQLAVALSACVAQLADRLVTEIPS
jgi:uncharacterized lipoprotein YmbA